MMLFCPHKLFCILDRSKSCDGWLGRVWWALGAKGLEVRGAKGPRQPLGQTWLGEGMVMVFELVICTQGCGS